MGIVNVTPDSFSDGGAWATPAAAIEHAHALMDNGAAIIDVGGESTRPGARAVSVSEEMDRVLPVVEGLRDLDCVISVDTRNPLVMRAAIAAGADMINDVQALKAPGALEAVARDGVAVCLMHMRGQPDSMQQLTDYADVVDEVSAYLRQRVEAAVACGIGLQHLVIDPGIGFAKTLQDNLRLIRRIDALVESGLPVLLGVSRKTVLGQLTGQPVERREAASLAAQLYAMQRGVKIFRVHDVASARDAMVTWQAIAGE